MAYGTKVAGLNFGTSGKPITAGGAHIFGRQYFRHAGSSGDVRAVYADLDFTGAGSGETLRVRGIANGLLCATGGTINAIHATGRVAAAKTVSGSLNGIRATLEVAGTTPTPGGKLAALRVDSNIVTGWTAGNNDGFIAVGNVGAGKLTNLFVIDDAAATDTPTSLVSTHADHAATHLIKCRVNGADMWLLATNAH
jgi:hypothetical protein